MDSTTLLAHRAHRTEESDPVRRDLTRLTPAESELCADLCQDRLHPRLSLEQERIGYGWLIEALRIRQGGAVAPAPVRSQTQAGP